MACGNGGYHSVSLILLSWLIELNELKTFNSVNEIKINQARIKSRLNLPLHFRNMITVLGRPHSSTFRK